ncbi:MAG TPA: hypothetical protein VE978_25340 [Chitinophagales bacterium]|nr:hypothetical protein [Chitinophagales bacterium]
MRLKLQKKILICFFGAVIFFSYHENSFAQQLSNFRTKSFPVSSDTLTIDTLSIIPGSVIVEAKKGSNILTAENYSLDEWKGILVWKKKPSLDTIVISYRVLPVALSKNYFHKSFATLNKSDSIRNQPIIYSPEELSGKQTPFGGLDYNGSFSRGITFGNNQDLVVNSSFNLQLQGKLAGDVDVLAAMSDANIPIQPEGNTQQIQDFDKIFIQFKKNKSSLTVGDYELSRPNGYFMNFYKKLQGASFSTSYAEGKNYSFKSAASAAVAKGKYAHNSILGQEGNQGPYRLTGNNGELFIIILAGTERVFIDGLLMQRGSDRDYVIDYNSGEITFTPTRLITKDKRIEVEFQYSDKAFLRTIFYANQEMHSEKWNVRFNFYNEQDAKNQPLQQALNDTQKIILEAIGDSLNQAYYPSIDSVAFTADRPLYKKIDTLGFTIYVYSTNPDSAHFAVNFSYVGSGKGNYVIANNLVNGRVYRWVAPLNGLLQGDYEPVVPIIAPQRTQLLTFGTDYMISKNSTVTWEGALSNTDLNTFSSIDNNNNVGFASHLGFNQKISLDTAKKKSTQLLVSAQYEFAAKTFKPLERYRPVEFERDWNIQNITTQTFNEHLGLLSLNLQKLTMGNVQYTISFFSRSAGSNLPSNYNGLNNAINGNYVYKGFHFTWVTSYLTSKSDSVNTRFLRPSFDISQAINIFKGITVGVHGEQERNRIFVSNADSLQKTSFYYNEVKVYLKNNDTAKIRYKLDALSRIDYTPVSSKFEKATVGNTANFSAGYFKNPNSVLQVTATYRELKITDTTLTTQKPDQSVLGRLTYDLNLKKGFISSNTLYEVGSGQEPKLEFAYAPVPSGTGTYTWIDYNGDGIQQINEFEIAAFQSDANFIRVFLPTNQYVKAYTSQFNEALTITPTRLWSKPTNFQSMLSRFSGLVTLQITKKTFKGDLETQFNPFLLNVNDDLLFSTAALVSGFLYFNKSNPHYGIDLSFQNNRSKNLLTNGVEVRTLKTYGTRIRWNISKKFSTILKGTQGDNGYALESLPQNDYFIKGYLGESQIIFQPSNVFRLSIGYSYGNSKNTIGEVGEKAINNKFTLDMKYNVISKSVLTMIATFANITYNGVANSPVQYAMLQGLQKGQNYLLNISFERKLSSFLEMTVSYEGRKTGVAKIVHTGQAQIRALF